MWDKIQQIINEQRRALDVDRVDDHLWGKIERELPPRQRAGSGNLWLKMAAVLVILAGTAFAMLQLMDEKQDVYIENSDRVLQQMFPELAEAEQFYLASVQSLQTQIEASDFPQDTGQLDYLQILDSTYLDLKIMLAEDVNREQIIAEMVTNLQLRIRILENQLMLVKEFEKRIKQQENEKPLI